MQAFEKDLKTIINYSKEHKLSQIPSSDLSIQEESINYLLNHGLIKVKVFDMIPWITVTLKGKSYFTDKKVKDSESRKYRIQGVIITIITEIVLLLITILINYILKI